MATTQPYETGKNKPWNVPGLGLSAPPPSPRARRVGELVFIIVTATYGSLTPCWALSGPSTWQVLVCPTGRVECWGFSAQGMPLLLGGDVQWERPRKDPYVPLYLGIESHW